MPIQESRERAGIDRRTGKLLTGWEHTQQSIAVILTTRVGERVMRPLVGSDVLSIVDRPILPETVALMYTSCIDAIHRFEPNFRVTSLSVAEATPAGQLVVDIVGVEFPAGHRGDFSRSRSRELSVNILGALT